MSPLATRPRTDHVHHLRATSYFDLNEHRQRPRLKSVCGIAGLFSNEGNWEPQIIERMTAVLDHRGPDASGTRSFHAGLQHGSFGHTRLSIVDLANGAQPMCNEDESVWITYNGEVYNHAQLRSELKQNHQFKTNCDTEVIIHAYEQWGTKCVERLSGMFSFAIWDSKRNRVFAARDRLGIKPFYYAQADDLIIFASEIKAIIASGLIKAELACELVPEQMTFGYLAGENTLFAGIKKLMPGHWMCWEDGKLAITQYWDIPEPRPDQHRSDEDWVDEFSSRFRNSVQMRLMSDVPLGVFLSGGLDSSSIAATMATQVSGKLKTFSVGFEAGHVSELGYAREVATDLGTDHHEVVLTPEAFFSSLAALVWHEDEPIRSSPSVALYHVAKLASEHVKVVLTGEGSDELFAGYDRYWATLFNLKWGALYKGALPGFIRERCIRQTLWKWPLSLSLKKKLSHTFLGHRLQPEEIVFDNFYAIFPRRVHADLFAPEMAERTRGTDPYEHSLGYFDNRCSKNRLDQLLYTDQKSYLVELLMKQDNMSMAASLESRVPFLDHELVEFAVNVPDHLKLHRYSGKRLVKLGTRQLLPKSVLQRKKTGFPVPFGDWLRSSSSSLVRGIVLSDRCRQRNIFNVKFVQSLLEQNQRGERDHTEAIWSVLNMELWARIFLDGESKEDVRNEMLATSPN